jgi:glycosyltransferase involved in cell wall biosynthesis
VTWLAVLLAAVGAVFFAIGARVQHEAVATAGEPRLPDLVRRPRWLAGLLLLGAGAGAHAVALGMAPVSVVQPVGVLAIGITALLDGRRRELPAVAVTTFGVGGFVVLAAGNATPTAVGPEAELVAGLIVLVIVTVTGIRSDRSTRGIRFGVAAGAAYGYASVMVRAVSQDVQLGTAGWSTAVSAAGMVTALLVGSWFVQHAYARAPAHLAVACLTVVDPLVAVGIGIGLLGEATYTNGLTALAALTFAAVAIGGVIAMTRTANHPAVATSRSEIPVNRIVIAAETFPPDVNGAARFAHRLAAGLAGRDHDVHVIALDPAGRAGTEHLDGITVHRLRSHRTPFHPTFRIGFPWEVSNDVESLLAEIRPDLVHVQSHFVVGRYVLRHASAMGIPTVATNHFMPENLFGHLHVPAWLRASVARWAWRDLTRVFELADVVTAPTPRAVELLHDNGFPSRAVPVSCGIDIDRYRGRWPAGNPDAPTVLFVGRLDEEKRVDVLLRAVGLVPGLHAEIVGDGSRRAEWERLAQDLGIADRVRFRGFVSEEDLLDAYAAADVFCMPGIAELQSLATMEAMAAGKPVVAADAMALPHLCHPGRNGWLFPPGDVDALAHRLHAVVADPTAKARMGAASSDLITTHTIAATLDTFESLYATAAGIPAVAMKLPA